MQAQLSRKLDEIRSNIGTDLDELGLTVKQRLTGDGAKVSFENTDGTAFSPIQLYIKKAALTGHKPTWEGSILLEYGFERIPVGSNGWILQMCYGPAEKYPFTNDTNEAMKLLKKMVCQSGVIFSSRHGGKYTTDNDFGIMYNSLQEELDDAAITCERHGDVESCNFIHVDDSKWRVALESRKAVLYVDGELIGRTDTSEIGMLVAHHVMNVGASSPFRK